MIMKENPNPLFETRNPHLKSTFTSVLISVALFVTTAFAQLKGPTVPVGGPTPEPAKPKAPPVAMPNSLPPKAPPTMAAPFNPAQPATPPIVSPVGNNSIIASTSILLLGLDDADLRQASNWQAPDDSKDNNKSNATAASMLEKQLAPEPVDVGNRPPGEAQMIAAPLRRIFMEAGATDVLNTALDGPSMVRAINAARLSPRVISTARGVMRRAEQDILKYANGAPVEIPAALQQDAVNAFTRIGQAMGYRVVVAVAAPPSVPSGSPRALILMVDCEQQTGQIIPISVPDQTNTEQDTDNVAAAAGALLLPRLSNLPSSSSTSKTTLANQYLQAAKDAAAKKDLPAAQDYINQVVGLEPNNADAYVTLGDLLQKIAPQAAATAYSRALDITPDNGALWSQLALTYTLGDNPSWPNALDAAQHALTTGYDSALLRTVMASAEFGRAKIFTKAGRSEDADIATRQAKDYMARALKLAPQDSAANADVSRLMAQNLLDNGQFNEAASTLDLAARQNPENIELQKLYATALSGADDRQEDAFVAWANVWKLEGDDTVELDAKRYKDLANGFDKHVFNLAKAASMLTSSTANGTIPATTVLPQVQRYAAELKNTMDALHAMRPPAGRLSTEVQVQRLIAGDLFSQAVQSYVLYLQNGDQNVLANGGQLHYKAIDTLNNARKAS
jgi:tetratricopeptide (TPR) repeat protein